MVLGLVLIIGATVAGGLALAAADHTVTYWSTHGSVNEGDPVARSDFTAVQVKVPQRTARTLLRTNQALPHRIDNMVWAESLRAGTLVSRQDLAPRTRSVEVPVTVGPSGAPSDIQKGDVVDVWVSPGERDAASTKAVKVLSLVRVLSRVNSGGMDGGPAATVVVDASGTTVDGRLISAVSTGRVTLVRVS